MDVRYITTCLLRYAVGVDKQCESDQPWIRHHTLGELVMKCRVSSRVWAVVNDQGADLPDPYNVTDPDAVEEVRAFIQRALAAKNPSDLHLPPKLSSKREPGNRYIVNISLFRLPNVRRQREVLRPALVVKTVTDNLWEIDFE
jgi:hypothetical protein